MSQNQKLLKIMSFVTVVAALGMAWWTFVSFMFANNSIGLLLAISALVPCLLDVPLGMWGIGAANKPARACETYYVAITWLAVVLNAVSVVVFVLIGGYALPSIVNCVIVVAYLYFSRGVRLEALR